MWVVATRLAPVPTRPRVLEFEVAVDRDRVAHSTRGGSDIPREDEWWPEHLVLAALVRCTLGSLDYAARRAGIDASGSGTAYGMVTRRETDGLYAFVEIETTFDVELPSALADDEVSALLRKAEHGCFVSNSLTARPRHRWIVNSREVT
jgi:organic hydroperoxide reductase OsmC/OhrA